MNNNERNAQYIGHSARYSGEADIPGKARYNRVQRLNALIKKEINQIFLRDFEFPEEALVTITRVDTAPNLNQTKIYISVLPDEKITNVLDILDKNIYETQQKLNRRLKMRPVPRIVFKEEEKTSEAGRIEKILGELKNEGKD